MRFLYPPTGCPVKGVADESRRCGYGNRVLLINLISIQTGAYFSYQSIWIADVKQRYPNLEIDGFDISLNQCPPSEFLPQGCSIRQLDIRADLPEDLRGVYDIVNMRLFIAAIKGTDLLPVLINIMTMLSKLHVISIYA